ncbi:MAG: nucleotidyltransferase domain-containing protein [bacterium]
MNKNKKTEQFCKQKDIVLLVLFGSRGKNKTHEKSDVDIAVLTRKKTSKSKKLHYTSQLEQIYNTSIDLVILNNNTDPLLLHEIFWNGQVLYEEKDGIFRNQLYRAWTKYVDTQYLRERERQYIKNFSMEK